MLTARLIGAARRLFRDRAGVAAVEFALILPVLCLFYFGAAEVTQGFMAQERATHTASTIGDLTAQSASLQAADVDDIFSIGDTIVYPFPTGSLHMRLSSVVADAQGNATVAWSRGDGMTKLKQNSSVTTPGLGNVLGPSQSVIMAEVNYTYTSAVGYVLPRPITFSKIYFLRPRLSTQVTCSDC